MYSLNFALTLNTSHRSSVPVWLTTMKTTKSSRMSNYPQFGNRSTRISINSYDGVTSTIGEIRAFITYVRFLGKIKNKKSFRFPPRFSPLKWTIIHDQIQSDEGCVPRSFSAINSFCVKRVEIQLGPFTLDLKNAFKNLMNILLILIFPFKSSTQVLCFLRETPRRPVTAYNHRQYAKIWRLRKRFRPISQWEKDLPSHPILYFINARPAKWNIGFITALSHNKQKAII